MTDDRWLARIEAAQRRGKYERLHALATRRGWTYRNAGQMEKEEHWRRVADRIRRLQKTVKMRRPTPTA